MTLYDALVKADEVRCPDESRLAPVTSSEIVLVLREVYSSAELDHLGKNVLPEYLKLLRITTTRPKKARILGKYSYSRRDTEAMYEYKCGESEIYLCARGLVHVFGKLPKTLYLSTLEKAK